MVVIVAGTGRIDVLKRDQAIAAAIEMQNATILEDGCISYRFYSDLEDPSLFHVYEEWESMEHLSRHFVAPHMSVWREKQKDFAVGAFEIKKFEATQF